ncbi:MAG: DUF1553 domain-containing protein, partial [Verrucomicrobiota bacterium]
GQSKNISRIVLWNRAENLHQRLDGATVSVLDEERNMLWEGSLTKATVQPMGFDVSGARGLDFAYSRTDDAVFALPEPVNVSAGSSIKLFLETDATDGITIEATDDKAIINQLALPEDIVGVLAKSKRTGPEKKRLRNYYRTSAPELTALREKVAAKKTAVTERKKKSEVTVMVMSEMDQPRPTYLLERGQYDKPDKSALITGDIPESLRYGNTRPADRLAFARWLVSEKNPLTARVTVNRYWQMYFGVGLVKTAEDFGTQGEWPSHPELLDWLAVQFRESGWDIKAMQKLMVTSATYRQSSKVSPALLRKDPENRLLARGPRFRMTGEAIRDQALAASGLLNRTIGGPPVKPYQPDGLWSSVAGGSSRRYTRDSGDKLYRRSMYTYWKRAVAPPRLILFDASGREACNVRARVTNTPLQALALMNDVTFAEAARVLAERIIEAGGTPEERIRLAYETSTGHVPDPDTLSVLRESLDLYLEHFKTTTADAAALRSVGESETANRLDASEVAAYTALANTILNLDQVVTKE